MHIFLLSLLLVTFILSPVRVLPYRRCDFNLSNGKIILSLSNKNICFFPSSVDSICLVSSFLSYSLDPLCPFLYSSTHVLPCLSICVFPYVCLFVLLAVFMSRSVCLSVSVYLCLFCLFLLPLKSGWPRHGSKTLPKEQHTCISNAHRLLDDSKRIRERSSEYASIIYKEGVRRAWLMKYEPCYHTDTRERRDILWEKDIECLQRERERKKMYTKTVWVKEP